MTNHKNSRVIAGIAAILSAATVFFTTSCVVPVKMQSNSSSTSDRNTSPSDGENSSADENKEAFYNIGDTVNVDGWEITVNSVEVTDKITNKTYGSVETYFSPDEGNKYVAFNVTIKNISTDSNTFLPIAALGDYVKIKIEYQEYEFNSTNLMGHSDELHMTTLNPLSTKTGILAFNIAEEVVDNFDALRLVFYTKKESFVFLMGEAQGETET